MNFRPVTSWVLSTCLLLSTGPCGAQSGVVVPPRPESQDTVDNEVPAGADTSVSSSIFEVPADSMSRWRKNSRFAYMAFIDSALRRSKGSIRADTFSFGRGEGNGASSPESFDGPSPGFFDSLPVKIFFWSLAVLFVLYLAYRLFFKGNLFGRGEPRARDPAADEPEKLVTMDAYESLIAQAQDRGDHNLAIRYLYLQTLKALADRGLIRYAPDKTNRVYVYELTGQVFQGDFEHLTALYEYVWYGKFPVGQDRYAMIRRLFYSFNQQI